MRILIIGLLLLPLSLLAQDLDDLMNEANEGKEEETYYTFATFKTTRLVNGHTVEQDAKGVLNFRISHRFGPPTQGRPFYNFLGLDQANIRLGFEYGVTNRLMIGVGRTKDPGKTYDGFAKYRLLRQSTGGKKMPISVSYFVSAVVKTADQPFALLHPGVFYPSSARWYYTHQLLIARKFNEKLSLQISPTLVHRNMVSTRAEANDVFSCGFGGRYMISGSTSINVEYYYVFPKQLAAGYYNCFSVGFDIETGGHVFQLHLTNSIGMTEPAFITETNTPFKGTGIRFGFNLSRVFNINT
ncbi:hypothetical protein GC194_13905 [bacterium]|nr:hypothetical protein [bacterium]